MSSFQSGEISVDVTRREFLTHVIVSIFALSNLIFLPIILILWGMGRVQISTDLWVQVGLVTVTSGLGWLLSTRGMWKTTSMLIPLVFLIIAAYGSSRYGLATIYILLYVLSIQTASMLLGKRWQWIVLVLALIVHWFLGAPVTLPIQLNLTIITFYFGLMLLVSLLQWLSGVQYETMLEESKKLSKQLKLEIDERRRIEQALKDSEEQFRSLVENITDIILLVDLQGKITYISPQVEGVLAISPSAMVGKDFISYVYPADQSTTRAGFAKILAGQISPVEFRVVDSQKRIRNIRAHSALIYKEGLPFGVTSVLADITITRKAISALRESENRLMAILNSIQTGIFILNSESLTIIEANPAALKMIGVKRDQVVGTSHHKWIMQEESLLSSITPINSPHIQNEKKLLCQDGSLEPIVSTIVPVEIDGKNHLLESFFSIREQKQIHDALVASNQQYRMLAENIPDGAVNLFDRDLRYVLADGEEYRKVGIDPTSFIGKKVSEGLEQPVSSQLEEQIKLAFEGERTQIEISLNQAYYLVDALPVRGPDGSISAVLRLMQNITRRKHEEKVRETLYRISEAAHHTENLADLYRSVHLIISDLIYAKNFYIAIYDQPSGMLRFPYFVDEVEARPPDRKFGNGLTEYVIRTSQPLLVDPISYQSIFESGQAMAVGAYPNDWLGVPLVTNSKTIGMLAVQTYTQGEHYFLADRDLLSFVSAQVAMVIARKQAEEAEKEQRLLAQALRESAEALNSTIDLDSVLDCIMEKIATVVPHDAVTIMLVKEGNAKVTRYKGNVEQGVDDFLLQVELPVLETANLLRMMKTEKPDLIPDVKKAEDWVVIQGMEWVRSHVGVPIMIKGELVGFIHLESAVQGFFTSVHADNLGVFANQAAIALENARLYAEVEKLAIVDDLTSIYNRRGLFELGEREIERARRFMRPLCALFVDIDHFKVINDTYGHQAGDEVLRFVAEQLRQGLREVDLLGRYGGEEFVIMLPETDIESGFRVAERLRENIANLPIRQANFVVHITISCGVIQIDPTSQDMVEICSRADQAMYAAKRAGRNRVVAHSLS